MLELLVHHGLGVPLALGTRLCVLARCLGWLLGLQEFWIDALVFDVLDFALFGHELIDEVVALETIQRHRLRLLFFLL